MRLKLQSLKVMIFGAMLMMLGGVLAVDPNVKLGGFEYLFLVAGLLLGIIGFWRED